MLKNLVGIVTGGASGLGRAAVTKLVEEGCKITICDLPNSPGKEVASSLLTVSPDTNFIPADIREEYEVEKMFQKVLDIHKKLDFVINCAGIAAAHKTYNYHSGKFFDIVKFQRVVDVNLVGTFNVVRYAAKYIAENEPSPDGLRGTIINLAGIEAYDGQMGQTAIAGSSGGIASMTIPLARDLSDKGIRVLCIAPGIFQGPLTDGMPDKIRIHISSSCLAPKRLGKPEEFGHAVKFLLENHYINATVLRIDGGVKLYYG